MRVLIVEDQENLALMVKDGLESEGFAADYITDGTAALSRIELMHDDYDVILLDVMLPGKTGIEIAKAVRGWKIDTPIIMLTAKDGVNDIIEGLNVGADDYLVKPFSFQVLLARIRAVLRRPKEVLSTEMKVGDITVKPEEKKVFRGGKEVHLTLKEFSLLEYLARHPNQVMNREQITNNVWDFSFDSFSNIVDVHITNLRKKLGDKHGKMIETVRGVGYRINR